MLKRLIIALIILSNLVSALMMPLILLDFEVRRDYIAEVLCINRDEPITVCGGTCYLDKKLGMAEEQKEKAQLDLPKGFNFYLNADLKVELEETTRYLLISQEELVLNDRTPKNLLSFDIFHPPRA
ncbi:hypothetical protein BXY85_3868 [Roseivirga pacifica]|uniref:Uncharacterized protein n=1 Tax=Roseivirga pacifica TaxID=1267423 RepID=A0A1I0Q4P0_9BACT|nr:hypothetical protein BXY85_3868 [Roseivirga pacifica]SEW21860.1 hypothetical protein SAMN05216290_2007 [Roseivirga pacifica]